MDNRIKSFEGKTALITGGSSGIGMELARLLSRAGVQVRLLARRKEPLESAIKLLEPLHGGKHGTVVCDVSKWDQVQTAVQQVRDDIGVPDYLINAAGVTHPGYVNEIPLQIYHEMMDINYFGTVHMVKELLPDMLERGNGHIVIISSASGFVTGPSYGAYSPSKYAVRGFSDVLRAEIKPFGLRTSLVFPPDTDTPQLAYEKSHQTPEFRKFTDDAGLGPLKFGVYSSEYVAKAILDGMQHGRYIIVPGVPNKIFYRLVGFLGNLVYSITDDEWAAARRKTGKK